MKKQFKLAMAVLVVLGAVKAMALSEEDAYVMNQQSKINAVEADAGCHTCQNSYDLDDTLGKIEAATMDSMRIMEQEAAQRVQEIIKLQNEFGLASNAAHINRYLVEQEAKSVKLLNELRGINIATERLEGQEIFISYDNVFKLSEEIQVIHRDVKAVVKNALSK